MTTPIIDHWGKALGKVNFKNSVLSVSRLKLYEDCAAAFANRYIVNFLRKQGFIPEPTAAERGLKLLDANGATDFGVLVHAVIESYLKWVQREEYSGRVRFEKLKEILQDEWASGEHNVKGQGLYNEALEALKLHAKSYPQVDHFDILGIELEFKVKFGEYDVFGYIDQVIRTGPKSIKVIDHKSNRMLFEEDYLVHDLQMSVYYVVARELFPWAEKVELEFNMLRYGEVQTAERHDGQIEEIKEYVIALGKATENGENYPERLNENCVYCEFRHSCKTFKDATAAKLPIVTLETEDVPGKLRRWNDLAVRVKPMYAEKKDLEKELTQAIVARGGAVEVEMPGEFPATFRVKKGWAKKSFEDADAIRLILKEAGVPVSEILSVFTADPERLRRLYKRLARTMKPGDLDLLKLKIESTAKITQTPGIYKD